MADERDETKPTQPRTNSQLEADVSQLREDIARLTEQLGTVGEHSYSAARRAAVEGAENLRAQGEAALDTLRVNARDLEDQVLASVRQKPVTALAVAAGVGFLFAMIAGR